MNRILFVGLYGLLSVSLLSCYAPVKESGSGASVYVEPQSESQKAAENYIALAFKYINENQLITARSKLDQARSFEKDNPRIYLGYALIYDKEQEQALATENFKKAEVLGGGAEVALYHALSLYNLGRYNQAQNYFAKCTVDSTFDSRALCFELNGFNEMKLNNTEGAIESFIKATQLKTVMPISYLNLANLYIQTGDFVAGDKAFKKFDQMTEYIDEVEHTAQSLWIGIQIANEVGESAEMKRLSVLLKINFPNSEELTIYDQWSQQP